MKEKLRYSNQKLYKVKNTLNVSTYNLKITLCSTDRKKSPRRWYREFRGEMGATGVVVKRLKLLLNVSGRG